MQLSQVHDGRVVSVVLKNNELTLKIESDSATKIIVVRSLQKLKMDNFLEGNIVNSVFVYSGADCNRDVDQLQKSLAYLYEVTSKSIDNKPSLQSFLNQQFEKLVDGDLVMIEVEPSYGCYLVALGEGLVEE